MYAKRLINARLDEISHYKSLFSNGVVRVRVKVRVVVRVRVRVRVRSLFT